MKRNKSKTKGKILPVYDLKRELYNLLKRHPKKLFNPKQIAKKLKVGNSHDSLINGLEKLVMEGKIKALADFKYKFKRPSPIHERRASRNRKKYEGIVDMTKSGDAYIVCEAAPDDIHVASRFLNGALEGDTVNVVSWQPRGRRRPEGEVLKVLKRSSIQFVGTLYKNDKQSMVIPDKESVNINIVIRPENLNGAEDGDKVVVKVTKWHDLKRKNPIGIITRILSDEGEHEIEMQSILINNGFLLDFPDEVIAESESLPAEITEEEIAKRRDFRAVTTFTIDPEDAKDFDDALSIEHLENGNTEIGIHIADVSHYVRPKMALDNEAAIRTTSVYLVDRVLPMLPEKLSNELCSLRPNEDKLTFSAVFTFDKDDQIVEQWFGKTIIHSDRRFSYLEAQAILDAGEGDFIHELKELDTLAKKLRKKRFKNGSIDFDTEEVRFKLNEEGVPVELYVKERIDAHMLIEEFMLLANKKVAKYIKLRGKGKEIPFPYRVHDEPDPDKVEEFANFAKELGYTMKTNTPREIANSYNGLAKAARENEVLKVLEPIAIRTMSKAEYSVENIGHYGLGFEDYAHFTSPIRRYADVWVHRILEKNLDEGIYRMDKKRLDVSCKHISNQERKAMAAERESIKFKQAEYIQNHIGETFEGIISGIIDRGIFVELIANKCEGMVGFEQLTEAFDVEQGRLRARGRRSGRIFKMGQRINVRVISVDLSRRQIEMELIEE